MINCADCRSSPDLCGYFGTIHNSTLLLLLLLLHKYYYIINNNHTSINPPMLSSQCSDLRLCMPILSSTAFLGLHSQDPRDVFRVIILLSVQTQGLTVGIDSLVL